MAKELVKEKVAKQNGSRDAVPTPPNRPLCGRGSGCVSEASYNHRGGVNVSIDGQNPSPQPSPARGEGACHNNCDIQQSQLNVKSLFAYLPIRLFTLKHAAFTLAEILVTLGVIGIVAAMTIPNLINNYQEKVTVTKVKKMYSTLNQAVKLAEVDNGPVITWDLPKNVNGGSQKLYEYLKPYLKVAKECVEDNSANCLDTSLKYYYLNGSAWTIFYGDGGYVRIILADGSLIWLRSIIISDWCNELDSGTLTCGMFWYDVNGKDSPNRMGKDIFSFFLTPKGIIPHTHDDCYLNDIGWGCAKWILENDNMDYPATKPTEN